jgi:formylglycine-generating enzyme required for sulfatase activity
MNFNFYIFGTPNGYNQYPSDNSDMFQRFAQANTTVESQLTVYRSGSLVYYAYIRWLQEKSDDYMGFCLVFNGVYCSNPQKLFSLFNRAFYDVQLKGEMRKFEKGKSFFTVNKFAEKQNEIERIKDFFKNYLENDFRRDFEALPTSFRIGNGQKSISVKETNDAIIAAIREYDCVHITNSEKSLSELERTQKQLTNLYAEKEELATNYRKLTAQKKQYKAVLFLFFIVIGCTIGLFTSNNDLKDRDDQISTLTDSVKKLNSDVDNLNNAIDKLTKLEMVSVAGGTFQMGCSSEQSGRDSDEKSLSFSKGKFHNCDSDENPLHSVTLSSFNISKYEITQAQWEIIMGSNPSDFKGSNLPVENVSWDDVQEFIRKLNAVTGKNYRLPTEAEWEYAARGGNRSRGYQYSGSNSLSSVAWYANNSNSKTHPVGTKEPNELGIYDMSGNVWEWCSDWKGSYSRSSQTNPTGPESGSYRVNRGGSWKSYASDCECRVVYRSSSLPEFRNKVIGFRLVLP